MHPAVAAHTQHFANQHIGRDRVDEEHGPLLVVATASGKATARFESTTVYSCHVRSAVRGDRDALATQAPGQESRATGIHDPDALSAQCGGGTGQALRAGSKYTAAVRPAWRKLVPDDALEGAVIRPATKFRSEGLLAHQHPHPHLARAWLGHRHVLDANVVEAVGKGVETC
jgi:hypothetical protein